MAGNFAYGASRRHIRCPNDRQEKPFLAPSNLYQPKRKRRWGTLALVVAMHALAIVGLGYVFAPDLATRAIDAATSVLTVNITASEPDPLPSTEPDAGAAGAAGDRATPRPT